MRGCGKGQSCHRPLDHSQQNSVGAVRTPKVFDCNRSSRCIQAIVCNIAEQKSSKLQKAFKSVERRISATNTKRRNQLDNSGSVDLRNTFPDVAEGRRVRRWIWPHFVDVAVSKVVQQTQWSVSASKSSLILTGTMVMVTITTRHQPSHEFCTLKGALKGESAQCLGGGRERLSLMVTLRHVRTVRLYVQRGDLRQNTQALFAWHVFHAA